LPGLSPAFSTKFDGLSTATGIDGRRALNGHYV
jgi:hypothetical protein